jgi:hypothetical protein
LTNCLEFISVGQYQTKLYGRGRRGTQSSWIGGLLTIIAALFVSFLSIEILASTFRMDNQWYTEESILFRETGFASWTLGQLIERGLTLPYFRV